MKSIYVYPVAFSWNQVIPTDYPFIHMKGPADTSLLLAFHNIVDYNTFCGDKYYPPFVLEQLEKEDLNVKNIAGSKEVQGSLPGGQPGSSSSKSGVKKNGVARRRNPNKGIPNVE